MYYTVYILYNFMWKGVQIDCAIDMKIGWAYAQPFPTLATPLHIGYPYMRMGRLYAYGMDL